MFKAILSMNMSDFAQVVISYSSFSKETFDN